MRILIASPIFPPESGGPAVYTTELVAQLAPEHECTVVTYSDEPAVLQHGRLIAIPRSLPLSLRWWRFYRALVREAATADVIYVQNAVAAGLPAVLAGRRSGTPVVLKFVGDEAWERSFQAGRTKKLLLPYLAAPEGGLKAWLLRRIQGFTLRRADIITTPSAYLGGAIISAYRLGAARVRTNYNAATIDAPLQSTMRQSHQLCCIGRLVAWKHIDGIIESVAMLRSEFPDIHLKIAGDGPERERLQLLARERGLSAHITLLGTIDRAAVAALLSESSAFVLNSTYEGLPHVVLEAFAAGTPVVATDIPGTNEVAIHEETALTYPSHHTDALAASLRRVFTEPETVARLTKKAKIALSEQFSWEQHTNALLKLFSSITARD